MTLFIPMSDELLYRYPQLLARCVPYSREYPCHRAQQAPARPASACDRPTRGEHAHAARD